MNIRQHSVIWNAEMLGRGEMLCFVILLGASLEPGGAGGNVPTCPFTYCGSWGGQGMSWFPLSLGFLLFPSLLLTPSIRKRFKWKLANNSLQVNCISLDFANEILLAQAPPTHLHTVQEFCK